jgi:hypothetical protein
MLRPRRSREFLPRTLLAFAIGYDLNQRFFRGGHHSSCSPELGPDGGPAEVIGTSQLSVVAQFEVCILFGSGEIANGTLVGTLGNFNFGHVGRDNDCLITFVAEGDNLTVAVGNPSETVFLDVHLDCFS